MRRHSLNPDEGIYEALHRAVVAKFLPSMAREAFEEMLFKMQIKPNETLQQINYNWNKEIQARANDNQNVHDEIMIPETLFYDNEQVKFFLNIV